MKEPVGNLWFTGEYLGGFERSAYVVGALEVGIETGIQLAADIKRKQG